MADLALLERRARRAYEIGRLRLAALAALIVVPLIGLTAIETGLRMKPAIIGGVLLLTTIGLRWWHRRGEEDATAGLQAGLLPLFAALSLCRFSPTCPWALAITVCGTAGVGGGLWLGLHAFGHDDRGLPRLAAGATVAMLMGALGCLALGAGSAIGVALGIAVGSTAVGVFSRRSA